MQLIPMLQEVPDIKQTRNAANASFNPTRATKNQDLTSATITTVIISHYDQKKLVTVLEHKGLTK